MRIANAAVGMALVLCSLGTFSIAAHAQSGSRERPLIRVPVIKPAPYWDYYLVPRYRYRPEDDRVDLCAGPVEPVISYGAQQTTVPPWVANALHLSGLQGRDWPCRGQHR
jgi:hypothetical protein